MTEEAATTVTPETREQIMIEADGASTLLMNPHLASVVEEIKWRHLNSFAGSRASERNIREDAYWAIQALESIMSTLRLRVVRAAMLLEEEQQETDNDE